MAFCTNCGAQLPDGSKFCTSCGAKFEAPKPAEKTQRQPEAPAQESAPVQGTYQPAQQSYTPPTQQEYSAQPAYAPQAKAPKQKKTIDKKTLFIIGGAALAVILAVVLIVVLGGKGSNTPANADPNLGVYNAVTAEMWGIKMEVSDLWTKGFSIELKDKGKCTLEVDGAKSDGKWTLEDSAFHVNGGGVDCNGTLANGVMTLEDVLGMGVTLTFEKEGGYTAPDGDSNGGSAAGTSALQTQWNGTWYGAMLVSDTTGAYADIPCDFYDAYMVVDVDGSGKGTFAVYLAGAEEALALVNCEASENMLTALSVEVAGGMEVGAYDWTFVSMPNYPGQCTLGDTIGDGDNIFDFSLFMKQWGDTWQNEIDGGTAIIPPSVNAYHAAIANGELPPVGAAPAGYEGSAAPSGGGDASGFTGPTATYNYLDTMFITYPSDTFFEDESAILDTIAAQDKSVKIGINPQISSEDHDATMKYYDSYSSYEQYATKNLTIAGYEARMITYVDTWGDYCANVHVNFGEKISGLYGVNFSISSTKSMEECTSDVVMAILNTITVS